jgi:hypothetical protein
MAIRGQRPPQGYFPTYTNAVVTAILVLVIVFGVLTLGFWGWSSTWHGHGDRTCNDFQPCTVDLRLPDGSCTSRRLPDGESCATTDHCYHDDTSRVCCTGTCVGNRTLCKGYCTVDADCDAYPLPLKTDSMFGVNVSTFCLAQSCVTLIAGGITNDCLSWLNTSCTTTVGYHAKYAANCLHSAYVNNATTPGGMCFLRYNCAPFTFVDDSRKRSEYDANADVVMGVPSAQFTRDPLTMDQYTMVEHRIHQEAASMHGRGAASRHRHGRGG